jgi:hypothetical protein
VRIQLLKTATQVNGCHRLAQINLINLEPDINDFFYSLYTLRNSETIGVIDSDSRPTHGGSGLGCKFNTVSS